MLVGVSGSSGLIGRAVGAALSAGHHEVRSLSRRPSERELDGVEVVVHLAAEPHLHREWTDEVKRLIHTSRVDGTGAVAEAMADMANGPRALLAASAAWIYGDRDDDLLTEDDPAGGGILGTVHQETERAAWGVGQADIRVGLLRFGVVIEPHLEWRRAQRRAGPFGRGSQWMPWVSLADAANAVVHLVGSELWGPINICAPEPATEAQVSSAAVGRSRPVPDDKLRAWLGETYAGEVHLWSRRAYPARLLRDGFVFAQPALEPVKR